MFELNSKMVLAVDELARDIDSGRVPNKALLSKFAEIALLIAMESELYQNVALELYENIYKQRTDTAPEDDGSVTERSIADGNLWTERSVTVKKGQSVATVLGELGARPDEIKAITVPLGWRGREGGIEEGQKLRVLLISTDPLHHLIPIRVIIIGKRGQIEAAAALSDAGKYIPLNATWQRVK